MTWLPLLERTQSGSWKHSLNMTCNLVGSEASLDVTIINVYKPPPTRLTRKSLPVFKHPCIYTDDLNCHHTEWGYSISNNDGTCLVEWASTNNLTLLLNPKEPDSFHSARWISGTSPDLTFTSSIQDQPSPTHLIPEKFPRSQHRPSLITPVLLVAPSSSKPVRRWNVRKADWDKFKLLTNKTVWTYHH